MAKSSFTARSPVDAPADRLYDWHLRPGAFERLTPPWEPVRVVERSGPIGEGARVVLELRVGPARLRWSALHRDFEPGRGFTDLQERGPFRSWIHRHRFLPEGPERSMLEDAIEYELPFGALGRLAAERLTRRKLARLFAWRHAVTRHDLSRHAASPSEPLHVAISGASGLVGSALGSFLTTGGHRVSRIARGAVDPGALEGIDAVVHLAGENVAAGRWTAERKMRIRSSRIDGTRRLAEGLARLSRPPRVLVCASAIGYYGDRGEERLDETSAPGDGFLAETCVAWEAASAAAEQVGIRVVRLRIGVVLSAAGGALAKMLPAFRLGAGGPVGGGRQWLSWIDLDDLVGIVHHVLIRDDLRGALNAVAPEPVPQRELARTLGRVLRRPALVPLPGPVVRALFGEMGQALLLASARVVPARLLDSGFSFARPGLETALRFELGA